MKIKWLKTSIFVAIILVGTAIIFINYPFSDSKDNLDRKNVSMIDGKQIVVINVKGGYQPKRSVAKSGIPTLVRFNTNGTFDCSLSIRIPIMNVLKILPQTGITDIDIGAQPIGKLSGYCGMGMYKFEIQFE